MKSDVIMMPCVRINIDNEFAEDFSKLSEYVKTDEQAPEAVTWFLSELAHALYKIDHEHVVTSYMMVTIVQPMHQLVLPLEVKAEHLVKWYDNIRYQHKSSILETIQTHYNAHVSFVDSLA